MTTMRDGNTTEVVAKQPQRFGMGALIGAFVAGLVACLVGLFIIAWATGGLDEPGNTAGPVNEYEIGESIAVDNSRISGAFTECGKATTDKFPAGRHAVGEPKPRFAYMAGDGVVVVGAQVTNGAADPSGMTLAEMFDDMHRALVVCSMRNVGGGWEVVHGADPEVLFK